jgi:hypothetical protein
MERTPRRIDHGCVSVRVIGQRIGQRSRASHPLRPCRSSCLLITGSKIIWHNVEKLSNWF